MFCRVIGCHQRGCHQCGQPDLSFGCKLNLQKSHCGVVYFFMQQKKVSLNCGLMFGNERIIIACLQTILEADIGTEAGTEEEKTIIGSRQESCRPL